MRFLSADWVFPLHIDPIENGIIEISEKGEVVNILEGRNRSLFQNLEIFNGILCPGFVNAHCHLELSHLLGKLEKGRGFLEFLSSVSKRNDISKQRTLLCIEMAEQQMIKNGIVAVGDICNTADTIFQKRKKNMQYYNFIESFEVDEQKIENELRNAYSLREDFRNSGLKATIVPHSPYSVPPKLSKEIARIHDHNDDIMCIHMQETKEENQLFNSKTGDLFDWLNKIHASEKIWQDRKKPIDIVKEFAEHNFMLVHNTFSQEEDINDHYYCTCPKSNLYISNSLPDYSIFNIDKLCVGTDSLLSNDKLSILEELFILQENSDFDLNDLLKMASKNGSEALGFKNLGTFEKGKSPGINLIQNLNETKIIQKTLVQKLQ